MVSFTENEAKTLAFLTRNFSQKYTINQLAKELNLSPGGMFKILKKLKSQDFLRSEKIGNGIIYKINFDSQEARDVCTISLVQKDISPYLRALIKDLQIFKDKTQIAILFGSILKKENEARDIDILLVFEKKKFNAVEQGIENLNKIKTKKIHAVYQTKEDLIKNIHKCDKVILEEIKTGVILWGRRELVEVIKNGQS
ncbi:winged helix-turn-helix transcriptional regulator [Candidatus Woesearchaeota archaeon]|nr:winged helix-turn-helix transcriptional regulator [Candidatus Woesearchaeota archaeon]